MLYALGMQAVEIGFGYSAILLRAFSVASDARHYAMRGDASIEPLNQFRFWATVRRPLRSTPGRRCGRVHSGEVLYAYNEHLRIQPASLAKIMTFYITLEALKNGKLTLDTSVNISEKAWRLSVDETVLRCFWRSASRCRSTPYSMV